MAIYPNLVTMGSSMVEERWKIGHKWKKDKENIQKTVYPEKEDKK